MTCWTRLSRRSPTVPPLQTLKEAPGDYNGLLDKIKLIRQYYRQTVAQYPEVRTWAEGAVGRGDRIAQLQALFNAVKSQVNYVGDPSGYQDGDDFRSIELIKSPWTMIDEIDSRGFSAGDCDDQASLNYTLLKSCGFPSFIRVIWTDGSENPSHIYAVTSVNNEDVAFDTCAPKLGTERDYDQNADFD
jgi:transglutaminase-like putative cysteine protease